MKDLVHRTKPITGKAVKSKSLEKKTTRKKGKGSGETMGKKDHRHLLLMKIGRNGMRTPQGVLAVGP